jgi:outer membrane protein TolC
VRLAIYDLRSAVFAAAVAALNVLPTHAQGPTNAAYSGGLPATLPEGAQLTNGAVYPIDLPTTLRLAGARNLDIQIAREGLAEAQANRQTALEQFFPWISAGVAYNRGEGAVVNVPPGTLPNAHYQFYNPGAALTAQTDLGEAIYNSLAARQLARASDQALETQRQDAILSAAQGYFDLVEAKALAEVARQAIQISQDYQQELHAAVTAGIAFKGDELRVQTQTEQEKIVLQQAMRRRRVAAVNLAQVLHLDSRVELTPLDAGVTALKLFPTNASVNALVEQALASRPELKQSQAFLAARRAAKTGAVYGPLIPSVGAQAFEGGLGGGPDGGPDTTLNGERNYAVGMSWRLGPGGLFDAGRTHAAKARLAAAQLADSKLRDTVIAQVVAGLVQVNSTAAVIDLAERNLSTADETLRLTRQRKQYGVGIVLEDLQAQQALTQARSGYVTAVTEHDKAQYALNRAVGGL